MPGSDAVPRSMSSSALPKPTADVEAIERPAVRPAERTPPRGGPRLGSSSTAGAAGPSAFRCPRRRPPGAGLKWQLARLALTLGRIASGGWPSPTRAPVPRRAGCGAVARRTRCGVGRLLRRHRPIEVELDAAARSSRSAGTAGARPSSLDRSSREGLVARARSSRHLQGRRDALGGLVSSIRRRLMTFERLTTDQWSSRFSGRWRSG